MFVRFGSIGVFTAYGCKAGITECVFMVIGVDVMTVGILLLLKSQQPLNCSYGFGIGVLPSRLAAKCTGANSGCCCCCCCW